MYVKTDICDPGSKDFFYSNPPQTEREKESRSKAETDKVSEMKAIENEFVQKEEKQWKENGYNPRHEKLFRVDMDRKVTFSNCL